MRNKEIKLHGLWSALALQLIEKYHKYCGMPDAPCLSKISVIVETPLVHDPSHLTLVNQSV